MTRGAAAVKILSTNGLRCAFRQLVPEFERALGCRLEIHFDTTSVLERRIRGGESFEVTFLNQPVVDGLVQHGKASSSLRKAVAQSGIGIVVRAGAPLPDISTVKALKQTLQDAQSVIYGKQGASDVYFASLLERLELAEALKPKTILQERGLIAEEVATGKVELGVQHISELLAVRGVAFVGPLPPDVQQITVFSACFGPRYTDQAIGRRFISFLSTAAVQARMRATGLEPL